MTSYYQPGSDLTKGKVGREIFASSYEEALFFLRPGEELYATVEFERFTTAPWIGSKRDWDGIQRYPYQLYALTKTEHSRSV